MEIKKVVKKPKKSKGIKQIKLETYLKHNPIFKSKDLRLPLQACRREIAYILSKIKVYKLKNRYIYSFLAVLEK
jgi:hypothetical protein